MSRARGFTLAELMIALGLMGVIAIFTIPKVLNSVSKSSWNADAKSAVMMVQTAYTAYQEENQPSTSTGMQHLTPYLNYIRVDTTSLVDSEYGYTATRQCGVTDGNCLRLNSGATLRYQSATFGTTDATGAIWFSYDPDGKVTVSGSPAGAEGKAIQFFLYYNGDIVTWGGIRGQANSSTWTYTPWSAQDPSWFSWGS